MSGYPVTCPECNGNKGWVSIDGTWAECHKCSGNGYVDEDEIDEIEDDEEE